MEKKYISEKIEKIAKKIFDKIFTKSKFYRFLLTGEDSDPKSVLIHMWKVSYDTKGTGFLLLESAVSKADTPQEKKVFEELMNSSQTKIKQKELELKEICGPLDDNVLSNLVVKDVWMFSQFLMQDLIAGSFISLLAVFYAIPYFKSLIVQLKYHPNFKPNKYYVFFCAEEELKYFLDTFRDLVDAKNITSAEEKHLLTLTKKSIVYWLCCIDTAWTKPSQPNGLLQKAHSFGK